MCPKSRCEEGEGLVVGGLNCGWASSILCNNWAMQVIHALLLEALFAQKEPLTCCKIPSDLVLIVHFASEKREGNFYQINTLPPIPQQR